MLHTSLIFIWLHMFKQPILYTDGVEFSALKYKLKLWNSEFNWQIFNTLECVCCIYTLRESNERILILDYRLNADIYVSLKFSENKIALYKPHYMVNIQYARDVL